MSDWIALGRDAAGCVGYALSGDVVKQHVNGSDTADVITALGRSERPIVRIGEGAATSVPCGILPDAGAVLPALNQSQPADVVSAWVRLWVAGYLARHQEWDGVICVLHGDVTHWIHLSAAEVVSCQSSLTQRIFAALGLVEASPDENAITDSLSRPEKLATQLRVAEVSGNSSAALGHLIGAELAATRAYWLGQQVAVVGAGTFAQAYADALIRQGVPVDVVGPDDVLPAGLAALGKVLGHI